MSAGRTGGLLGLLLILMAAGSLRQLSGQAWIRIGGDLNPMGERNPVTFAKLGLLIGGSTFPFTDATALLLIQCTTATPPPVSVALHDGPSLRRAEGQARIAPQLPLGSDASPSRPPHAIRWGTSGDISLAFLSRDEPMGDPEYVDLRHELQEGDILTDSVDTSSGTLYYRFSLDGFEIQENLCPAEGDGYDLLVASCFGQLDGNVHHAPIPSVRMILSIACPTSYSTFGSCQVNPPGHHVGANVATVPDPRCVA